MDWKIASALKRIARGLGYAAAAGAVTFLLAELPSLGDVVPAPEISIPVLTALLLGVDKWIRARRAEQASQPEQPPA